MSHKLGYGFLIEHYKLKALPLSSYALIDSAIHGRQKRTIGGQCQELFEPAYQPKNTLIGHLQFALRYQGLNLHVMALLFDQAGEAELCEWITASPESRYARRACFLYEWITGSSLPIDDPVPSRASYIPVVNVDQQFASSAGERLRRFRVLNNLPGSSMFCPMADRSELLQEMLAKDLKGRTQEVLEKYEPGLLRRAAAYLYLKETQSSFEVEREKSSPQRQQRFADLLKQADTREVLTEARLVELQNAVLDPRFHEYTWRSQQNWIGKDLGYSKKVDFVPPRPEHLTNLMTGLLAIAQDFASSTEPVVAATAIAFGFVYIHPFMDGNGRIHRYLIHDVLAKAGFTPRGIILPVSAVILANLDDYIDTLEHFSHAINQLTDYHPDTADIPAQGNNAVYFRFPNFTRQTEFLYRTLERTVKEDLQKEINYLLGFDSAYKQLNEELDWPAHSLDLFIRVVEKNGGTLSNKNRQRHFDWMRKDEIERAELGVQNAFAD
ncbi:MAG: Fic family protein [Xanthomonadales bacterium]|nr:Fic family protein [Xanthomonadales bacterium]